MGPDCRNLFKAARAHAPSIIFLDEIDSIARKRNKRVSSDTINQVLAEMDGFAKNEQVVVVGCTNVLRFLDPAILRPGRFDRIIRIPLPTKRSRSELLKFYIKKVAVAGEIDCQSLAQE